ncbi:hypothetical protein MHYP_G00156380 [Metynnis hypsauchen]
MALHPGAEEKPRLDLCFSGLESRVGVTMFGSKSGFTSRVAPRSHSRPTAGLDWIVDVSTARVQALAGLDRPLAALAVETGG